MKVALRYTSDTKDRYFGYTNLVSLVKKDETLIYYIKGEMFNEQVKKLELNNAYNDTLDDFEQFFDENIINVSEWLADKGLRVICGGLDSDFRGVPFNIVAQLLAMAEKVTKLTAICVCCGEDATKTQRIINGLPAKYDDPIILVGEKESYESRCRKCHVVRR